MIRSLDADAVADALRRTDLPDDVRRVLEIREASGSASVKKLYAIENQTCRDDRLRDLIKHHGARTGRPTGAGPQPLNLPKAGPKLATCDTCAKPYAPKHPVCPWCGAPAHPAPRLAWKPEMVDHVLEVMSTRSLDAVEWFFGDALLSISGCVRGLFVAGPGRSLIASDYSAIEAVVAACGAGEQWRIDTFNAQRDIYLMSASAITGIPYETYIAYAEAHGENHPDRQIGKVAELACFGPRTQVLTDSGYKAIVDVKTSDKLWDGVEWIEHRGIVAKGSRSTINLDGVRITPDHLINSNGSWKAASELISNVSILSQSLETGSANLPWPMSNRVGWVGLSTLSSCALAEHRPTRSTTQTSSKALRPDACDALSLKPGKPEKSIRDTPISCRTMSTADGCSIEYPHAFKGATIRKTRAFPTMADGEFTFTKNGGAVRAGRGNFSPIWSLLKGGTARGWSLIGRMSTAVTSRVTSALSLGGKIMRTAEVFKRCKSASPNWSDVYDIAHAGPRNRFTIKTDSGHLIVHNCGFMGWIGAWRAFDPDSGSKSDDEIKDIIVKWRAASPRIVALAGGQSVNWQPELHGIEGAAIEAIQTPGRVTTPRAPSGMAPFPVRIEFQVRPFGTTGRPALFMRLPSGRELTYHEPRLSDSGRSWAPIRISYKTENTNPKYGPIGWVEMDTYSGRLWENWVQAVAHDIQRHGIELCRAAGYDMVLGVYDEDVFEVPEGSGSVEEVERLMGTMPPWAAGWPIRAAGGWAGRRYRKG